MLHIHGLSKQYGGKKLFMDAEAHLGYRSRVALIGPNGAGKSTLTKIILGLESPDAGKVTRAQSLNIGYLPQELPKYQGGTVIGEVMRMDGRREELLAARVKLENGFADPANEAGPDEADLERYGRILEELEHLDEYTLESRAETILLGMGFKAGDYHRPLSEFSGGWLMRVALSRILLMDPDLLLLDEPTNHLDLESVLWLEEFLREYRGAMILISHDTAFLNRIVQEVIEIDQQQLFSYRGNLESYAVQKQERLTLLKSQFDSQQSKIAEIEAFVARFGAKATKARQAQSRLKQLEKMDRIELPEARDSVGFRFPPAPHSGKEVITVKNAGVSFQVHGKEKKVFADLNWVIRRGTRTAIVGVNGAGKTTLLKVLAGALEPTRGQLIPGHEVRIGYYAQMQAETLDPKKTILQELEAVAPEMGLAKVRAIAGAFLFTGDDVHKKTSVLSGGEKARVALAKLLLAPSNFLILDEPTNHLDVESRGVLLEALQEYNGTLCLVSHDRDFVSPLADSVLEILPSPDGSRVHQLVGGYEDYLAKKLREASVANKELSGLDHVSPKKADKKSAPPPASKAVQASVSSTPASPAGEATPDLKKSAPSNNQKRAWEREKEKLEGEISQLEKEQALLTTQMADPASYADKDQTWALVQKQREVDDRLARKMARWEELSIQLG